MEYQHTYDDGSQQEPLPLEGFNFAQPPKLPSDLDGADEDFVAQARQKLEVQLASLRGLNRDKLGELERMGATLVPHVVLLNRLDQLLDMVLTDDTRLGYELGFEARMSETLDLTLKEVRMARLSQPPQHAAPDNGNGGPPGFLLPG